MIMHTAAAYILSTGASYGNTYSTEEMLEAFHKQRKVVGDETYDRSFADRVFRACGFDGHSVALAKKDLFRTMSREEYLEHRQVHLIGLAQQACEKALAQWGGNREDITHLFWGTMTGAMDSPTIDIKLTQRLGLSYDIQRTSIEGMGCLTGFRLLNLAQKECLVNPKARVLVIAADLRSALGNALPTKAARGDIVSVSLFRDAASAAVVGGEDLSVDECPSYEIVHGGSRIVKDGLDLVKYRECNGGSIQLHLSKDLPVAIGREEPAFVKKMVSEAMDVIKVRNSVSTDPLLATQTLTDFDVVCHTGGPRVLKEVAASLGVTSDHLLSSWAIMKSHGNLSGASNLAVLDHHNSTNGASGRDWVLCLSMGPGACLEGVVLRRISSNSPVLSMQQRKQLMTQPLGDPGVEEMVRQSIEHKIDEGHVSARYPKMWQRNEKHASAIACQLSKYVLPLAFGLALVLSAVHWTDDMSTAHICGLLVGTIISTMVCITSSYQLDDATKLSFFGVSIMMLGAIINVSVAQAVVGVDESSITRLGSTLGFSFLALGVQIFSFASFVFLAWQFMVGSVLLSMGLLLRACAALIRCLLKDNFVTVASYVDVAAIPIFIIALVLMGARAYFNMRKPWLCPPNFVMYGTVAFGFGEVLGGSTLSLAPLISDGDIPSWMASIDSLTRGAMVVATALLALDSAVTRYHLERTMEYSYPAMTMIVNRRRGIDLCRAATWAVLIVAIVGFLLHSFDETSITAPNEIDAALSLLLSVPFGVLALMSTSPNHVSSTFKHKHQATSMTFLAMAQILRGLSQLESFPGTELSIASSAAGVVGSLAVVVLAVMLPMEQWRIKPLFPQSYLLAFHPANYFLLSSSLACLTYILWLAEQEFAGYLVLLVASLLMQVHWSMTLHVYKITQPQCQKEDLKAKENAPTNQGGHDVILQDAETHQEVDVLVVGAGPTGLLIASILGKHGVSVMLVEARPQPVEDARFTVINSASMEVLANNLDPDIFAELRQRAMPDSTPYGSMLVSGLAHEDAEVIEVANAPSRKRLMEDVGSICDTTESRILGSKHASELPIRANQSHQEQVLKKQAERHKSVQVLYGHRLLEFQVLNDDSVQAIICQCSSESRSAVDVSTTFSVRSRFIVGADGPRSTVAQGLGIHFDGFLNVGKTRSLLVRAPGLYKNVLSKLGGTFMYQVLREKFGLCGIVAADPKKELWNFLMIIGAKTQTASTDEICQEFLGTTNYEVVQDRNWFWNFFIAREFRKGPGFLAGDAAHSWPPFGALGGNSGFGDAANLGWKLASVCRGQGGDSLLESYAIERRQQAIQTALFVLSLTPRPQLLNKYVIPYANSPMMRGWIRNYWYYSNSGKHIGNHFCQSGVQMGTKYNHSPIVNAEHPLPDDPFCEYLPCVRGGGRLPFFHVRSPADPRVLIGVYDLVASLGYTAFVMSKATQVKAIIGTMEESFRQVNVPFGIREIDIASLCSEDGNTGTRAEALKLWGEECVILVRPDNVVAWHLPSASLEAELDRDWADECRSVVSTVTGLSTEDGSDLDSEMEDSERYQRMQSYQDWLTKQFRFNLRPYQFIFPNSVQVHNETKEEAMDKMRKKAGDKFDVTTRNKELVRSETPGTSDDLTEKAAADDSNESDNSQA